jgi:hypothetical protein
VPAARVTPLVVAVVLARTVAGGGVVGPVDGWRCRRGGRGYDAKAGAGSREQGNGESEDAFAHDGCTSCVCLTSSVYAGALETALSRM